LTVVGSQALSNSATRSRIKGFLLRKIRWEFWPAWAAYLPLLPYFLYLAIKHRSLTLFTLANPGIESGGFVGESKSAILRHLSMVPGAVAPFALVDSNTATPDSFPVVLKPDQGERGKGVAIIRSREQWTAYWSKTAPSARVIAQQYVPGEEFGIYYVRYPGESRGRIPSITAKTFPRVTGDGVHTVHELVLQDHRAVCMAGAYAQALGSKAEQIPNEGQQVQLVEIGSHCRGSIFLDASHLTTDALTEAVDRVAKAHPGFHIGRFDVRSASANDLREGRFQVIELNGVSAEPAHIYDPQVSLVDAYRALMWQWRTAFEIGSMHRNAGIQPMNVSALLRRIAGE